MLKFIFELQCQNIFYINFDHLYCIAIHNISIPFYSVDDLYMICTCFDHQIYNTQCRYSVDEWFG